MESWVCLPTSWRYLSFSSFSLSVYISLIGTIPVQCLLALLCCLLDHERLVLLCVRYKTDRGLYSTAGSPLSAAERNSSETWTVKNYTTHHWKSAIMHTSDFLYDFEVYLISDWMKRIPNIDIILHVRKLRCSSPSGFLEWLLHPWVKCSYCSRERRHKQKFVMWCSAEFNMGWF